MFRCYNAREKFFELLLGMLSDSLTLIDESPEHVDVHQGTIAWIMKRAKSEVCIVDASAGIPVLQTYFKKQKEVKTISHPLLATDTISNNHIVQ